MSCLDISCRDCDWHVLKNDKIDCNYNNRLGMGQVDITTLLGDDPVLGEEKKEPVIK